MDQHPSNSPAMRGDPANSLGIAGFVVSLVGLFSCGLLSPIGAIMSMIAVGRRPRGLAIAGIVIGLIGSLWLIALIVGIALVGIGGVLALVGFAPQLEAIADQYNVNTAIKEHVRQHGALPGALSDLTGLNEEHRTDPWGSPYRLETLDDGVTIVVISDGPDKSPGTSDDIRSEFDHTLQLEGGDADY